ncbi:MAG: beta-ribofuranosylaminobenzene 5'-phosphate synthase [Candidatus Bathyarchaeota archaeon B26-1]|nr:MAG: beta-ribofuranosylaminobenzene 5'-phosphate synthase [Candidatus Bathyarchaeota archaeon B26-1]
MFFTVESSARLHLGFYTISGGHTAYGSIGVAIEKPRVTVQARGSDEVEVRNLTQVRVEGDVAEVVKSLGLPGAEVKVLEAIPRHVGLGSTTQIRLSLAYALSRAYGMNWSVRKLAFTLGRGWVSGIGVAAFEHGGFILDSGRTVRGGRVQEPKSCEDLPKIVYRMPLPEDWYFVVAVPKGIRGLDEREERPVLEAPKTDRKLECELHEAVLTGMLPALARGDAEVFGKALTKVQRLVGRYFSRWQGGEFCCWETEEFVEAMLRGGAYGAGQSSWGPTAYGLVEGEESAKRLLENVRRSAERIGVEAEIFMTRARNGGFSFSLAGT